MSPSQATESPAVDATRASSRFAVTSVAPVLRAHTTAAAEVTRLESSVGHLAGRLERELEHKERLATIGRLAASMAQEAKAQPSNNRFIFLLRDFG